MAFVELYSSVFANADFPGLIVAVSFQVLFKNTEALEATCSDLRMTMFVLVSVTYIPCQVIFICRITTFQLLENHTHVNCLLLFCIYSPAVELCCPSASSSIQRTAFYIASQLNSPYSWLCYLIWTNCYLLD
jgi:hypothetical protein